MIPVIGVAAVEGWSGNGNYYFAPRLKELHGQRVPMLWCHEGSPDKITDKIPEDKIIGHCTVFWNGNCLLYAGEVKEEFDWCVKLAEGASIGVFHDSIIKQFVIGKMILVEVSLVLEPSISSASLSESDIASIMKLQSHLRARGMVH